MLNICSHPSLPRPTAHIAALIVHTLAFCAIGVQQYVPLFLTREDLDVAVRGAHRSRHAAQIGAVRSRADELQAQYDDARREVCVWLFISTCVYVCVWVGGCVGVCCCCVCHPSSPSSHHACVHTHTCTHTHQAEAAQGRDRSLLEARATKLRSKLDDALAKAAAVEAAPLPKIEVCCMADTSIDEPPAMGSPQNIRTWIHTCVWMNVCWQACYCTTAIYHCYSLFTFI